MRDLAVGPRRRQGQRSLDTALVANMKPTYLLLDGRGGLGMSTIGELGRAISLLFLPRRLWLGLMACFERGFGWFTSLSGPFHCRHNRWVVLSQTICKADGDLSCFLSGQ